MSLAFDSLLHIYNVLGGQFIVVQCSIWSVETDRKLKEAVKKYRSEIDWYDGRL